MDGAASHLLIIPSLPFTSKPFNPYYDYTLLWSKSFLFGTAQGSTELPAITIPLVLSYVGDRDLGRVACISREWTSWVQREPFANRAARAKSRAQVPFQELKE